MISYGATAEAAFNRRNLWSPEIETFKDQESHPEHDGPLHMKHLKQLNNNRFHNASFLQAAPPTLVVLDAFDTAVAGLPGPSCVMASAS